jgi:DNA-binding HxlR family transcriptional regulator
MKQVAGYGHFRPMAIAAEVLCTRWSVLVPREMYAGSMRCNDLRNGVPTLLTSI